MVDTAKIIGSSECHENTSKQMLQNKASCTTLDFIQYLQYSLNFQMYISNCFTTVKGIYKNSISDAHTPQPGEIFFNTMRYRRNETVQRSGYFQSSVSYIKVQIMFKYRKMMS